MSQNVSSIWWQTFNEQIKKKKHTNGWSWNQTDKHEIRPTNTMSNKQTNMKSNRQTSMKPNRPTFPYRQTDTPIRMDPSKAMLQKLFVLKTAYKKEISILNDNKLIFHAIRKKKWKVTACGSGSYENRQFWHHIFFSQNKFCWHFKCQLKRRKV